jgi:ABC-type uncharacterized transport system permease subunit
MDLSDDTSGKLSKKSIELLARPGFSRFAYSAVAVFLALLIGAILIGASGYSVKEAYYNLFMVACGRFCSAQPSLSGPPGQVRLMISP